MTTRRLQIPAGMQDTLPGECRAKRALENELRGLFTLSGYREIETPILEYYDALDDATYGYRPEHVWKTFDRAGRVLAIRPDSTIPSARLAAGALRSEPLPLRLFYLQSAAEYEQETLSMLCEHPQAGVELFGDAGPQADAEAIALSVSAMRKAGLRDFQIELGQADFFAGFMQDAGLNEQQIAQMRQLTERKDILGIQLYLRRLSVSDAVIARLMKLPLLYGGPDVLDKAAALTGNDVCRRALDNLRSVMDILRVYGVEDELTIDLGMVHEAGYYSGVIFRGQTAEVGQPILSGGRYDGLPARYGRAVPAVGFALSLKLLLIALEKQGQSFTAPVPDVMVGFAPDSLEAAIRWAAARRAEGHSVSLEYGVSREELQRRVNAGCAVQGLFITRDRSEMILREVNADV